MQRGNPFQDLIGTGSAQGQGQAPQGGGYQQLFAQYRPQPTKPKQQKKKDFWTDQISTGGGIGGALGGAATGAAIGSIVPGIGTAIGGLVGGIAGGALGSGAGEFGENVITGEKDKFKNVGQEAVLGGIFSAPPVRLAKGVIGAAKGASSVGARKAFEDAFIGVAKQAAKDTGKTTLGGKLADTGTRALMSQYGTISKPFARSTNPKETISTLANAGIIKPSDAERIAAKITGSNGLITQAVSKSVGNAKNVDTSTLRGVFDDALDNIGLVEKDRASIQSVFDAQMNRLSGGAKGSLNPKANPTEAQAVLRSFEKRIANLLGKGDNYRMSTPERMDQASVLRLVKDELEDQIYVGSGANKNLSTVLTPELRQNLISLMPKNPKWVQYVDKNIMGAQEVGALRSSVAPFVRVSKIIDEGDANALTFGGRAGNFASGGGVKNALAEALTNVVKDPAARAFGKSTRALAGAGGDGAIPRGLGAKTFINPKSTIGQAKDGLYARPSPLYSALGQNSQGTNFGEGGTPSLEDSLLQQSQLPQEQGTDLSMQQTGMETQPVGQSPYTRENLMYDMQRDPENAENYMAYYTSMQEIYAAPEQDDYSQSSKSSMASSDNAIATLDQLEALYNKAGGGNGRIGGWLQGINANAGWDENAKNYDSLSKSSVTQIAKALAGAGSGTVSNMDAQVILEALPKLGYTPEEARINFAALRQRLETARNNTMRYGGGGGGSLEEILMQQQQGAY